MLDKLKILYYYLIFKYFHNFKSRQRLQKYQKRKIKTLFKYVGKKSSYYSYLSTYNTNDFTNINIIDKTNFMKYFNKINTVGVDVEEAYDFSMKGEKQRDFKSKLKNITVGLSSGTSGHRGIFLVSDKEKNMWVGAILAKCLYSGIFHKYKIAFFLRADSNLYEAVGSKNISFKYFDMYDDIKENVSKLNKFMPDILVAPPQVLLQLINFDISNLPLKKIISVAEVLEANDRNVIQNKFRLKIDEVYQCTEGFLAHTCQYGSLHINEDIVKLEKEYIDRSSGRFIPIITDMYRRSQPIIRYKLNDILVEDNTICKCGSAFCRISKIEGRQDDIFIFKGKNGEDIQVYPDFIRRCFLFSANIKQYRVEQLDKSLLYVYIDSLNDCKAKKEVIEAFEVLAKDLNFDIPTIIFKEYVVIQNRKLVRVERKF